MATPFTMNHIACLSDPTTDSFNQYSTPLYLTLTLTRSILYNPLSTSTHQLPSTRGAELKNKQRTLESCTRALLIRPLLQNGSNYGHGLSLPHLTVLLPMIHEAAERYDLTLVFLQLLHPLPFTYYNYRLQKRRPITPSGPESTSTDPAIVLTLAGK